MGVNVLQRRVKVLNITEANKRLVLSAPINIDLKKRPKIPDRPLPSTTRAAGQPSSLNAPDECTWSRGTRRALRRRPVEAEGLLVPPGLEPEVGDAAALGASGGLVGRGRGDRHLGVVARVGQAEEPAGRGVVEDRRVEGRADRGAAGGLLLELLGVEPQSRQVRGHAAGLEVRRRAARRQDHAARHTCQAES